MNKLLASALFLIPNISDAVVFNTHSLTGHINGYLGYKYITSTAKNDAIVSNPELGFNLCIELTDNWSTYTQFQYDENINNAMVYNFLSYKKQFFDDAELTVNVGKLRHNYGLYNSTRVNPSTRQGVIMPQAIYWDSLAYLVTSGIGFGFIINWSNFNFSYTVSQPNIENSINDAKVLAPDLLNSVESSFGGHQSATFQYSVNDIPLIYKGSWNRLNLGNNYTPLANRFISATDDYTVNIWTNSFKYTLNNWTLTAEAMIVQPSFTRKIENLGFGYSITAQYELNENISLRANYNEFNSGQPQVAAELDHNYAKDINIGINYHRDNFSVGAEVHHINGGRWVEYQNWRDAPSSYKEWWIVGINAVFYF